MFDDTIAAIATPLGEGGLAVVRLSGPQAFAIADKCFQPVGKSSLKPSAAATHTIQFGKIVRGDETMDEVLVAVLRAPRTFTREDTVEITCHGGLLPAKLVLDTFAGKRGARGRTRRIYPARLSQRTPRPGPGRGGGGFDSFPHRAGAGGGQ